MSKSHIHPPIQPSLIHMHAHPLTLTHTHSFPFSPLIMFLYLTFKVPEIGMFPNQNCFFKGGLIETHWYRFSPSARSALIKKTFDYDCRHEGCAKTGGILSPGRIFVLLRFPAVSVVFERGPSEMQSVNLGKCCAQDMRWRVRDSHW